MTTPFPEIDPSLLQTCIHCGLCLYACPTYTVLGQEADSPRGRLTILSAIEQGGLKAKANTFAAIDRCLGCLGCESACPSGVPYGQILEQARSAQRSRYPLPWPARFLLNQVTRLSSLRRFTRLLRLLQNWKIDRLLLALRLLPKVLRQQLAGLPALPKHAFSNSSQSDVLPPANPDGVIQGRVLLFTGCIMDSWFAEVHQASARVLRWNGFEVELPPPGYCCGAMHSHMGLMSQAQAHHTHTEAMLQEAQADAVIHNAAGCSAMLKEHSSGRVQLADIAEWLVPRFIALPESPLPISATYDAPCHQQHAQGVTAQPLQLLEQAVEKVVPLPEADICCGSAGLYSLVQTGLSRQLMERKAKAIMHTGADVVVTANPGCQLQIKAGLHFAAGNGAVPVRHLMEVIDQAYARSTEYRKIFGLANIS